MHALSLELLSETGMCHPAPFQMNLLPHQRGLAAYGNAGAAVGVHRLQAENGKVAVIRCEDDAVHYTFQLFLCLQSL